MGRVEDERYTWITWGYKGDIEYCASRLEAFDIPYTTQDIGNSRLRIGVPLRYSKKVRDVLGIKKLK